MLGGSPAGHGNGQDNDHDGTEVGAGRGRARVNAPARYAVGVVAGVIAGVGAAAYAILSMEFGSNIQLGPWVSGTDFGSREASDRTRAVVAVRGLLALPASEARYYTAETDDAGRPLDGRCTYRVSGGDMPANWWSITLYDDNSYLVSNPQNVYSLASVSLPAGQADDWELAVSPNTSDGHWLPTGGVPRFSLTLRAYLPDERALQAMTRAQMPAIERQECN